ncbi:helix-turn-helix DNA binding domain protein [Microbacterium phage Cinna]|uniref:Helix-turn-helix DNA binding domain protein n=2 Tax=Mementomorivirus TaxID=2733194 RepID=A0A2Z4Q735_9CAUD|nr:HTH DNA binding protein [Microbacterium phage MementoMori]YP_010751060.1 helix-turn-helix DNA binding domain protein [Microbacterium phage Cinna]AWY05308.1 helix-turn-helix DNA binding domain protein [Microbacterium phage MementoMori]QDH91637.1 helix-turn-helix DNA binding domain protein [Microbacterium phage Cinna]
MSIRRGPSPADRFAQIANAALRDKRLSWKARGLLAYLLSHREGWRTSVARLEREAPDGRDSVRAGLNELIEHGYVTRSEDRIRDARGRLGDYEYTVTDFPTTGFPTQGEPTQENPHPKNTRGKNTIQREHHPNGGGAATPSQRAYLRDLHIHGGGRTAEEIDPWLDGLTVAQADAEIGEALRAIPRGKGYVGDPEHPGLSEKGREVAARRLIPEET